MEKLTLQEEEAMLAVWQVGPGFIKDFMEAMPEPKPPYTTLASTIKNLERKAFLISERYANANRYSAKVKEAEYKKRFMNGFVNNYFHITFSKTNYILFIFPLLLFLHFS